MRDYPCITAQTEDGRLCAIFQWDENGHRCEMLESYDPARPNDPGRFVMRKDGKVVLAGECGSLNESVFTPSPSK